VSHRRGRPEDDPDGAEVLLGWSGLTEEDAMEWGRRISRPPAPGTWRSGALHGPPTHASTPAGELDGAPRAVLPRNGLSGEQDRRGS
jgi:hypothetical protein